MTRKDYVAIAAAINKRVDGVNYGSAREDAAALDALQRASIDIAATMANDNPAFDRSRFLKACGVQS